MGVDLTLIPLDCDRPEISFGHSLLHWGGAKDIQEAFDHLDLTDVPAGFSSFRGTGEDGEHKYGETSEDKYGEGLKCATADELYHALREYDKLPEQRAVLAYLAELPPTQRVALYWH